jgi:hypothetical protein
MPSATQPRTSEADRCFGRAQGGTVELDGSASSDPDGEIVSDAWSREKRLDDATRRRPMFDGVVAVDDDGGWDRRGTTVRVTRATEHESVDPEEQAEGSPTP